MRVDGPVGRLAEQLRQLGDIGGDAPRFVAGQQLRGRSTAWLVLEVDVRQRLPVVITDDETGVVVLLDRPGHYGRYIAFQMAPRCPGNCSENSAADRRTATKTAQDTLLLDEPSDRPSRYAAAGRRRKKLISPKWYGRPRRRWPRFGFRELQQHAIVFLLWRMSAKIGLCRRTVRDWKEHRPDWIDGGTRRCSGVLLRSALETGPPTCGSSNRSWDTLLSARS
jgi:hypothetical protein